MRLKLEHDDGTVEVFQDITDLYLAVRQYKPVNGQGGLALTWDTTSYSWGSNARELLKELRQSADELQDYLRSEHGGHPD